MKEAAMSMANRLILMAAGGLLALISVTALSCYPPELRAALRAGLGDFSFQADLADQAAREPLRPLVAAGEGIVEARLSGTLASP
jgi:hypothetical protein